MLPHFSLTSNVEERDSSQPGLPDPVVDGLLLVPGGLEPDLVQETELSPGGLGVGEQVELDGGRDLEAGLEILE